MFLAIKECRNLVDFTKQKIKIIWTDYDVITAVLFDMKVLKAQEEKTGERGTILPFPWNWNIFTFGLQYLQWQPPEKSQK